jgi:hypothetical protein
MSFNKLFIYTLRTAAGRTCTICQDECTVGQRIYEHSTCKNQFHVECFIPWMERSAICPTCRGPCSSRLAVQEEPAGRAPTNDNWWFRMPSTMDHILTYALLHIVFKRLPAIRSINHVLSVADITVDHPESSRPYKLMFYDDMFDSFDTLRAAYERYHERIPRLVNAEGIDEPWRLTPVRSMIRALIDKPTIKRLAAI